jgi:ABC-type sugar transport system substrate-binding protein
MRKGLALVLAFSMVMTLAACGSSGSASGSKTETTAAAAAAAPATTAASAAKAPETTAAAAAKTETTAGTGSAGSKNIMFVSIVTGGVAWGSAQKGFEDALKEVGWKGQYNSPTSANDTSGVIDLLDTAVTNKADGIITVILDTNQATDVLTRARKANIPVVTCNTYTNKDLQDCWIGTDPHNMGVTQAETAMKYFEAQPNHGDNITACYIQTTLKTETQNKQFEAFTQTIKAKYPNAVLVQDECNSDAAVASDKLAALLKSYPDMNVVVSQDGYGCPGIANYVESEGLGDKLVVIGIDDSEEILNYVKTGALDCTIAQDFYKMGSQSVHFLKDIMDGKKPAFDNDSGTIVIGPDEVAEHLKLLQSRGLIK